MTWLFNTDLYSGLSIRETIREFVQYELCINGAECLSDGAILRVSQALKLDREEGHQYEPCLKWRANGERL